MTMASSVDSYDRYSDKVTGTYIGEIDFTGVADRNSNTALVVYKGSQGTLCVTGSSKRLPGDEYSFKTGCRLALADALDMLAHELRISVGYED